MHGCFPTFGLSLPRTRFRTTKRTGSGPRRSARCGLAPLENYGRNGVSKASPRLWPTAARRGLWGRRWQSWFTEAEARGELLRQCLSVAPELEPHIDWCLRGFLGSIEDGARGQLLASAVQGLATDRIAHLFRFAPFRQHTWRLLDRYDQEVRDRYWRGVMPDWDRFTEAELFELVDQLLHAKRPRAAFFAAHLDWSKIATPQLLRLLVEVGSAGDEADDQYLPRSHDIAEAIHDLDGRGDVDPAEMIRFEFMYIQALDHSRYGIPNLERWLSESPIGFVQVLAIVFKRDDGGEDPAEWRRAHANDPGALASAALRLLERVTRIPGSTDGGDIDSAELSRWVTETRRLCAEYGRARIGDRYIGQFLARGPAGKDGVKPCVAVSEAMEAVASQDIAAGFSIGTRNARGVVSRAVGEGGKQERELAERYRDWAARRSPDYPYVGSILEGIAADYDRQGAPARQPGGT